MSEYCDDNLVPLERFQVEVLNLKAPSFKWYGVMILFLTFHTNSNLTEKKYGNQEIQRKRAPDPVAALDKMNRSWAIIMQV